MGVEIIKDIKISQVAHYFNCCSKDVFTETNSNEIIQNDINNLTQKANDKLQYKYSNKIPILSPRNKIKNIKIKMHSNKNKSLNTISVFNTDSEPRMSKLIKIQSYIRGILFRKKLLENHIMIKELNNIKSDNNKEEKDNLDIPFYFEESLISKYNI